MQAVDVDVAGEQRAPARRVEGRAAHQSAGARKKPPGAWGGKDKRRGTLVCRDTTPLLPSTMSLSHGALGAAAAMTRLLAVGGVPASQDWR